MKEDDLRWHKDAEENGWKLGTPPFIFWRLPVIRNVRCAWHSFHVYRHAAQWASAGIGIGGPNQFDLWYLYAVARGWA